MHGDRLVSSSQDLTPDPAAAATTRRNVLLLCLSFAAFGTVWGAFQAVTAELQLDFGFAESRLGLLLLLPPLFGVPAALAGSRIVARFGSQMLIAVGAAVVTAGLLAARRGEAASATPWIAMAHHRRRRGHGRRRGADGRRAASRPPAARR